LVASYKRTSKLEQKSEAENAKLEVSLKRFREAELHYDKLKQQKLVEAAKATVDGAADKAEAGLENALRPFFVESHVPVS
jgi:hypothetical protein